eukprot:tig00000663_g2980.t1
MKPQRGGYASAPQGGKGGYNKRRYEERDEQEERTDRSAKRKSVHCNYCGRDGHAEKQCKVKEADDLRKELKSALQDMKELKESFRGQRRPSELRVV